MNQAQKFVAVVGVLVLIAVVLFPPWIDSTNLTMGDMVIDKEESAGFALLFDPPEPSNSTGGSVSINYVLMLVELAVVVMAAGVLLFVFKSPASGGARKT